jgi:steroid delta-isomerase-like uncharacterized protein
MSDNATEGAGMIDQLDTTAQANKRRQLAFVKSLQHDGELERTAEFVRADFVDHCLPPGAPGGIDGVRAVLGMIREAFPDHDAEVIQMVAEGDLVATHKAFTGTHRGTFLGVPPTGRRATIRVMDFVRYEDGRIAEHWNVVDVAGLMAQLA